MPSDKCTVPGSIKTASRLFFIDNIRVMLTIQVIIFHLMITYAGTGSWYYTEGREDLITGALGAWFLTVSQAYFMGLFLLISAYFVPGSYDRKGPARFLRDRLIRLGIPLLLYSWMIRPLLAFLDPIRFPNGRPPFLGFVTGNYFKHEAVIGGGPLWFIEVLLIFSILYVLWRLLVKSNHNSSSYDPGFPGSGTIALFALLLGVAAFCVRLWLPAGWNFVPLNLQFPFFVQYIGLFVIGLIAYRRNWLIGLPEGIGRFWLGASIVLIILFWPLLLGGGALDDGLDLFRGGMHWQAFAYAMWESFLGISMCIGLVYIFRRYGNRQGKLAGFLSRNAYAAYLVHEVVIIVIAYTVMDIELYPLLKWAVLAPMATAACFILSSLIKRLPYANRVL